jgi:two-component sensor histidine kinase
VSSVPTFENVTAAAWPRLRAFGSEPVEGEDASLELGFRFAAVQVGFWLGWASIVVVLGGLALDVNAQHRWLLITATLAAAAGNTVAMVIPWREWLATRRGRVLLDLWCGGLIAFVALLVVEAGSNFALLLFLAVPFIAVVQIGWRRGLWLVVSAATCAVVAALIPLAAGATAMRLSLVAAAVIVALVLARTIRREAAAHKRAAVRADLERTLSREANHRIKNDLQTAADLLMLARPHGSVGQPFDETAARIRSIATVHQLLAERPESVDAGELVRTIAEAAPVPVTVKAEPITLDAASTQKLGIVTNELITNAFQHGAMPISVRLTGGAVAHLEVEDAGTCPAELGGLGLDLVRRLVEKGLDGRFVLSSGKRAGTHADVVFPIGPA